MTQTVGQLAARMAKAPAVLQADMRAAVRRAAVVLEQSARQRQPASGMLRNVGAFGAPIGVRSDVRGTRRPTALIRATGPLHLLDLPTRAHEIRPRRVGGRARRNAVARGESVVDRSAVVIPGVGPRRVARHRGTKGKRTFHSGIAAGLSTAKSIVESAFRSAPRGF